MEFRQIFDIHAVGQGLFYTGAIRINDQQSFNFVFDCGSEDRPEAIRELTQYRGEVFVQQQRLNLLIISHFDADHVNHIHELLAGGIKIDHLVMPFTLFHERLFLVLHAIESIAGDLGDEQIDTFRFTLDPLAALANNLDDGSQTYLINGGDEALLSYRMEALRPIWIMNPVNCAVHCSPPEVMVLILVILMQGQPALSSG